MTTVAQREAAREASRELAASLGQFVRRIGPREWEASRGRSLHLVAWALDGALLCNCEAAAFRLDCWAVDAVRKEIQLTSETTTALTIAPLQLRRPMSLIPSDGELSRMERVAAIILAGGIDLPRELDTPQKVMAVMLKGRALGLDPTIAIEHIHLIDGHAVPDAQIMAGILARDVPSSQLVIEHEEPEYSCTMRLRLPSRGVDASYTVTMDDADVRMLVQRDTPHQARGRGGETYTTKAGGWTMYPRDRLRWHATKRLLKVYAPDVINGMASIGMGDYEEPETIVVDGAVVSRSDGEILGPAPEQAPVAQQAEQRTRNAQTPARHRPGAPSHGSEQQARTGVTSAPAPAAAPPERETWGQALRRHGISAETAEQVSQERYGNRVPKDLTGKERADLLAFLVSQKAAPASEAQQSGLFAQRCEPGEHELAYRGDDTPYCSRCGIDLEPPAEAPEGDE